MNRLNQMNMQFAGPAASAAGSGKKDSLSVHDNRTGKISIVVLIAEFRQGLRTQGH